MMAMANGNQVVMPVATVVVVPPVALVVTVVVPAPPPRLKMTGIMTAMTSIEGAAPPADQIDEPGLPIVPSRFAGNREASPAVPSRFSSLRQSAVKKIPADKVAARLSQLQDAKKNTAESRGGRASQAG